MTKVAKPASQPTTPQSLGALLKSARDIMRKDKGLNGDLDRLPMLTWIMFLKFLDDLELQVDTYLRAGDIYLQLESDDNAFNGCVRNENTANKISG